jgi:hypothetical protein
MSANSAKPAESLLGTTACPVQWDSQPTAHAAVGSGARGVRRAACGVRRAACGVRRLTYVVAMEGGPGCSGDSLRQCGGV